MLAPYIEFRADPSCDFAVLSRAYSDNKKIAISGPQADHERPATHVLMLYDVERASTIHACVVLQAIAPPRPQRANRVDQQV